MSQESNCCSEPKSSCCKKTTGKCIYALLHILILTCMATSLWQISGHLADLASK
ncbi:MAG: hypothetical protein OR996_04540 [Phycisphaerales bacterium]|nr:hypothetical protein [Phycisphaerae bacterium]MDE1038094.1 hypothetical protein [Phycisphaerales bacterium]